MAFQKATKFQSKLRMAIAGPAGAGKTWTALTIATALADGKGVALVDTEHGSAAKYADVFEFDTLELDNFHPNYYITAIHEAEEAGYAVLVIDSLSHAWSGVGGVLDEKDKIARQKYGNNTFSAWNDATKLQNALVQAILGSKIHIIATVRSKMDYVLEKNEQTGKQMPRKVGLAPVQRDDLAYEFDVFTTMEVDNTMIVDKSRCPALAGAVIAKPDAKVAAILKSWLSGAPAPEQVTPLHEVPSEPISPPQSEQLRSLIIRAKQRARELGLANSQVEWESVIQEATGEEGLHDADLTVARVGKINGHLTRIEKERQAA
ncbi:MAG TPA: ATP-binding protein [Ktedonobacteraceae bacterium]|nr:ATP-binding protein [Ktedonobacteraceae bacterium]